MRSSERSHWAWFRAAAARFGPPQALRIAIEAYPLLRDLPWPRATWAERRAVSRVLCSSEWGGQPGSGKSVDGFARRFSRAHGARFGICTNSGTTALSVAYRALGVGRGHEVIVPALTFSATAAAALALGADVLFADVDRRTMCIDPESVERLVGENTKVVVAVHLGAQLCDLDALRALCQRRGLRLVEDCAHAPGAAWRGRSVGSWGDLGCFSFQQSKTISAGEGGIVITNDDSLAKHCAAIVDCGRWPEPGGAPHQVLGSNFRMTQMQAALLNVQLDRLHREAARRAANAVLLDELIEDLPAVAVMRPYAAVTTRPVYGYYLLYQGEAYYGVPRRRMARDLFLRGVPVVEEMYVPVYRAHEYGWRDPSLAGAQPRAETRVVEHAVQHELLWIPHMAFSGSERRIRYIARAIRDCLSEYAEHTRRGLG